MSIRSSIRIRRGLVIALLLCSAGAFAGADKKQELYDQAMKAGGANRVEEAAKLLCDLANIDPKFHDSKTLCAMYTHEAELERKRSDDRFAEGLRFFQDGRFDEAEQKFKNVRAGSHMEEARQYIAKIPAARSDKQKKEGESAKFDGGADAYRRNDFATAKANLGQVNGEHAPEAQILLDNIKRYEDAMAAGNSAAGVNDWAKAVASYNAAAAIKPDGPGDPRSKLTHAQTQAAAAQPAQPAVTAPKPSEKVAAIKEPAAVDVKKLLREATAAQAQGNYGVAAGKYLAVLAADPGNDVARRGLEFVSPRNQGGAQQSLGSEADAMLVRAIGEFYHGFYDDAEVHIKDYLRFRGSRTGLSNFYLGASELTRYYLAGERDSDKKLLGDARSYFQLAHGTPGFTPPDQSVISPKILKIYNGQ